MRYERIRSLREKKGMTQEEIANELGCSRRVYSNYERGDVDIPTVMLIKLSKFHKVTVDYILNLSDKMN